jgi:hypothetical protein
MVADVAVAVHVMKEQAHKTFLAHEFALVTDDEIPNVRENLVEAAEISPEGNDFLLQLVCSVMIQSFEPIIPRVF